VFLPLAELGPEEQQIVEEKLNMRRAEGWSRPETPLPVTPRANILGVGVSATKMDDVVRMSDLLIRSDQRGYICVTGVHGVMEAQSDRQFRRILNASFITTPDGMPMVWVGRLQGHRGMRRVYGPDYMIELCRLSVERRYKHFLYGGKPGVAERLAAALTTRLPGLQVVGMFTPPFRPLDPEEEAGLIAQIRKAKPDIVWVGLSTPRQEQFMAAYLDKLDVKLMVGVGAAFDIHIGDIQDAPQWVKSAGLQWLHRLVQEPRRLWKRYLVNNPKFVWNIGMQFLGIRRFTFDT
jgi:N-acetylglucosaminyldiphosphoundecaprenol N-acetyl-beta-D-mannosaminyltransferase